MKKSPELKLDIHRAKENQKELRTSFGSLKLKRSTQQAMEEMDSCWIDDEIKLNKATKQELAEARAEIKAGKFHPLKQIKKTLKLKVTSSHRP